MLLEMPVIRVALCVNGRRKLLGALVVNSHASICVQHHNVLLLLNFLVMLELARGLGMMLIACLVLEMVVTTALATERCFGHSLGRVLNAHDVGIGGEIFQLLILVVLIIFYHIIICIVAFFDFTAIITHVIVFLELGGLQRLV